jgi:hypothetical protein
MHKTLHTAVALDKHFLMRSSCCEFRSYDISLAYDVSTLFYMAGINAVLKKHTVKL